MDFVSALSVEQIRTFQQRARRSTSGLEIVRRTRALRSGSSQIRRNVLDVTRIPSAASDVTT